MSSLFDFDYSTVVDSTAFCGKYEPLLTSSNYQQLGGPTVLGADVIPADYDFSADLLEEPEHSMNLEEMIEGVYLAQDHSAAGSYQGDQDECNSMMLPRTLQSTTANNNDAYSNMLNSSSPACYSPAARSTSSSTKSKSSKSTKGLDKDSEEYKRRRTLNNIAVKKSREKAKAESRMTAQRLHLLTADKERLERRVDQLNKEIQFLHGLFTKFNDIPEPVKAEVSRCFARLQNHSRNQQS